MFGLLKNKIASFIDGLTKREEKKEEPEAEARKEEPEAKKEVRLERPVEVVHPAPQPARQAEMAKPEIPRYEKSEIAQPGKEAEREKIPQPESRRTERAEPAAGMTLEKKPEAKKTEEKQKGIVESISQLVPFAKPAEPKERKLEVSLSLETRVRSVFSSEVEIKEKDVDDLLDELNTSLLESDVAYEVAEAMVGSIRGKLVGTRAEKRKLNEHIRAAIRGSIVDVLASDRQFDLLERVRASGKPAKLLFVGPNGAGKTTTMAKLAHLLMKNGLRVVFSASDTFRAAAIEQTEEHARRLGVKTIKSAYGADPASVAFDSVSYAKAHDIDVVLIDSAGRQDTNANLINELKKINRVVKPDLKLYIGESIGGNAVLEQVKAFDGAVGLDGVILTKLDCDAKGGTALSITKVTNIPIIYIGVGQAYDDLREFDAAEIAGEIIGEAA